MKPEPITKTDFDAIVECLPAFWGERNPVELHHPMFVHEFGDGALLIRDKQGAIAAYLFGFFLPERGAGSPSATPTRASTSSTAVASPSPAPSTFTTSSATRPNLRTGLLTVSTHADSTRAPTAPRS
jgi:hypothetical protein